MEKKLIKKKRVVISPISHGLMLLPWNQPSYLPQPFSYQESCRCTKKSKKSEPSIEEQMTWCLSFYFPTSHQIFFPLQNPKLQKFSSSLHLYHYKEISWQELALHPFQGNKKNSKFLTKDLNFDQKKKKKN